MRRILAATALVLAGFSSAAPGAAAGARLPVRVVAPAPGTELTAGALAVVEWEAEGGLGRHIVEWEAFLSLDGGRTWPLRLTPHLDADIRRFSFRVPGFPSRAARLLLRFGDEREETEVDVPGSFTISIGDRIVQNDPLPPLLRLARGEPARSGEGGVVVWTEGSRDGAGLREVAARETTQEWKSVGASRSLLLPLFWPASDREGLAPPGAADLDWPAAAGERPPAETAVPRPAPATRVLIHRYNE